LQILVSALNNIDDKFPFAGHWISVVLVFNICPFYSISVSVQLLSRGMSETSDLSGNWKVTLLHCSYSLQLVDWLV